MGADTIKILDVAGVNSAGAGGWFDVSGYTYGSIFVATSALSGTSWTPKVTITFDDGTSTFDLGTGEIAAFAAITGTGTAWQPFIRPMTYKKLRIGYSVSSATFSAKAYFMGRVF